MWEDNRTTESRKGAVFAGGLQGKMFKVCVMLVIVASAAFAVIELLQIVTMIHVAAGINSMQKDAVKDLSEDTLTQMIRENMATTITLSSKNVDGEFWTIKHDYTVLADQVEDVFRHPDKYGERDIYPPDKKNKGKYVLQVVYAHEEVKDDPETMTMLRKLANLEPIMRDIVAGSEGTTKDCYLALPNGATLMMDEYSDQRFDEKGNIYPYDPTARPWYKAAVKKGAFSFTLMVQGYFLGVAEVEYGIPVYVDGELVAVLVGSTNLEQLQGLVADVGVGEEGFSILVSETGKLVCSPRKSGDLKLEKDLTTNILKTKNRSLHELINTALYTGKGFSKATIDGEVYYAAFDTLKTLGWTMITFVPKSEVEAPTKTLLAKVDDIAVNADMRFQSNSQRSFLLTFLVIIALIAMAFVAARSFSGKILDPIRVMTEKLAAMSDGEFVFEMTDAYRTGDEIELLAETFGKLSKQIDRYLRDILNMTAEKERIGAELDIAKSIQANMLPGGFPMFPDRGEFDLYATLHPAKEVGGDFYDAFFLDRDNLCLVMADVSGKGVPAALFMVRAMTLIRSRARQGGSPAEILFDVNNQLCEGNRDSMFVTAWLGILNLVTGHLTESNAGHEFPCIRRGDQGFAFLERPHNFVLGGMEDMDFEDDSLDLAPGDAFFIYTDGVPEARNEADETYDDDRLLDALNRDPNTTSRKLLSAVRRSVEDFVGEAEQFDDLTMLCVNYLGTAETRPFL